MQYFNKKIDAFVRLMRLDKPIGTILLFWPVAWALWLSNNGVPDLKLLIIFGLGSFLMRTAGCVINDLADRKIDGFVERTKNRPLVLNKIKPLSALIVFLILIMLAFFLVLLLNTMTIKLAIIALGFAVIYPFTKRITYLPQLILGIAFGFGVLMVYSAHMSQLPLEAWLLFLATILWTLAYDTMYAMVDRKDDAKIGIYSTAILFNKYDRLVIAILQVAFLSLMFFIGYYKGLQVYYYIFVGIASAFVIYQLWLIKDAEEKKCLQAFLNNKWVGLMLFVGLFFG